MYLNTVYEERYFENKVIKCGSIDSKSVQRYHRRKDCADMKYSITSRGVKLRMNCWIGFLLS
jgi:hypothetical protein